MKVLKFGGTSVGSAQRIKNVASLIANSEGKIVVLSAMSGTTNQLLEIYDYIVNNNPTGALETLARLKANYANVLAELFPTPSEHRTAASEALGNSFASIEAEIAAPQGEQSCKNIVANGELMSTALMLNYLLNQGVKATMLPALQFMVIDSNGEPDQTRIASRLHALLSTVTPADVYITQGFICKNHNDLTDNLKRGGSDYTASLIGAAVNADEIQIWTDIDGMHNNDPRFVADTRPVRELHFEEAAELAYFGAKILHPTCILPAKLANIPVRLLNTMQPQAEGTVIHNTLPDHKIKAVAAKDNITAIKIKSGRMLLAYGFLSRVFSVFERFRTPIDMVVTSEVGVSVTIDNEQHLPEILAELKKIGTITVDRNMVIICVVGDLQWNNRGFEAAVVNALKDIPVRMISYGGSNYNISLLIDHSYKTQALNLLSDYLFK
ncbi:MAG: aspartate kinase [Firmicutes bacterium]|nr:aspartate kinase [Bacillota bacterium]MCM1400417.1 aspartate kinase [Bacteroides sp.]MCM1477635.1 aspartate kinase [Bacteroides sp.]